MATPEEEALENIKKARIEFAQYKREFEALSGKKFPDPFEGLKVESIIKKFGNAEKGMDAIRTATRSVKVELDELEGTFDSVEGIIKGIGEELKAIPKTVTIAKNAYRKIRGVVEDISMMQADILSYDKKSIDAARQKNRQAFTTLNLKLKELEVDRKAAQAQIDKEKGLLSENQARAGLGGKALKQRYEELDQIDESISLTNDKANLQKNINVQLDLQSDRIDRINGGLGITGDVLSGLGSTVEKLGFKGFSNKVSGITEEMKLLSFEITEGGTRVATLREKFKILTTGIGGVGTALISSLTDPLVIAGLLLTAFKKLVDIGMHMSQEITDLGRSMNMSREAADTMFSSIKNAAVASGTLVGTTKDMLEAQMSINKILGTRVGVTGKELEAQVALTKLAGLSNDQAAELYKYSVLTGESSEDIYDSISDQGDGLLNNNEVLKEALEIEGQLAAQYKNDPKLIAQAVRQVKLLGISLQQAQSMGKSMLDFESSIESELEAQLLTGKSLNLSKVRSLALAGKTAQAAELALQQAGSSEEFTNMNVIAQESLAEAMGLSTDELAKSLKTQELINKLRRENPGLSKEQATLEAQRQNMSAGEKLAASMTKIQDAFAAIVGPMITPVVDMFSTVVGGLSKMPNLMKIIGGGAAVLGALALFTKGIPAIFGYFKSQVTKPDGSVTNKINTKIDQAQINQLADSVSNGGSGSTGGSSGTGGKGSKRKGTGRASQTGMTKSGRPDMRTKAGRQMAAQSKMKGGGMMSKLGGAGGALMSGLSMAAQAAPLAMSMGGRSMEEAGAEAGNRTKETVGSSMAQAGDVGVAKQATGFLGGITGKAGALLSKLSPANAVKKVIGNFGPKIMKSLPKMAKGIPFLGAAIESIFAGKDIAAMMSSGMPEDDIYQNIGRRAFQAIGGLLGGGGASLAIQAANIVPGLGVVLTPLAGLAGDFIGRSLGGLLADASPSMAGSVGKGISDLFDQSDKIKKGDKVQNAAGKISNPEKQTIKANDFTIQTNPADTLVMAGGTQFGKETNDILTSILNAVQSGGDVYIDGNKAGEALVMGTYKAS